MLGGPNKITNHNIYENSLLATSIIIDVLAIAKFFSHNRYGKIKDNAFKVNDGLTGFNKFYPILIFLCYLLKTPLTRPGSKPTNFLNKQRYNLENFLRLLIGLSSKK